jgi:hypothetical protein
MFWPSLKPFVIGEPDAPYLKRWFILPRNRWFNIYLHHFHRSDDDKAIHDHPWRNLSILLKGSYLEHMADGSVILRHPTLAFWRWPVRRPTDAHRVELIDGRKVWTLFITGRRVRTWGFWCPRGWIPWTEFVELTPGDNKQGKGCE